MANPPPLEPYWNDSQTVLLRKLVTNTAMIAEGVPDTPGSLVPVPASAASPGAAGQFAVSAFHVYFYSVAAGGWRRAAIGAW